jgi:PadR family transcriptional regulator PadR
MDAESESSVHLQELRRGTVLTQADIHVEANTLYPLLRRLETQGLLLSEWDTSEPRPRKYYRTTPAGEELAATLRADWARLDRAIEQIA